MFPLFVITFAPYFLFVFGSRFYNKLILKKKERKTIAQLVRALLSIREALGLMPCPGHGGIHLQSSPPEGELGGPEAQDYHDSLSLAWATGDTISKKQNRGADRGGDTRELALSMFLVLRSH